LTLDALTLDDIDRALVAIAKDALTDPEAAASRERRLLHDVILHVAAHGDGESVALCRAVMRTFELEFRR
jgi:hypothetical protein